MEIYIWDDNRTWLQLGLGGSGLYGVVGCVRRQPVEIVRHIEHRGGSGGP
jgi:hypothetical protein